MSNAGALDFLGGIDFFAVLLGGAFLGAGRFFVAIRGIPPESVFLIRRLFGIFFRFFGKTVKKNESA